MKETCDYHGHSIELDLSAIARDGIRWTYFIDGRYCTQGVSESSSMKAVRLRALALAHRSIDVLDSMRLANGDASVSRATDSCLLPAITGDSGRFVAAR